MKILILLLFLSTNIIAQNHCQNNYTQLPIVGGSVYTNRLNVPQPTLVNTLITINETLINPHHSISHLNQGVYYHQWSKSNNNGSWTIIKANCEPFLDFTNHQNSMINVRSWLIQTDNFPRYIITSSGHLVQTPALRNDLLKEVSF